MDSFCCEASTCVGGQRCDIYGVPGHCASPGGAGAPCSKNTDCGSGLFCDVQAATCKPLPTSTATATYSPTRTATATWTPLPPFTPTPTAGPITSLLGTWAYTYTIINTFTDTYDFTTFTTAPGYPALAGTSLNDGAAAILGRIQDIDPGSSLPYEWAAFHESLLLCELYLFDTTGPNSVAGLAALSLLSGGTCGTPSAYAMIGVRTSSRSLAVNRDADTTAAKIGELTGDTANDADALQRLLDAMHR